MKTIHFYAQREDLVTILELVDGQSHLKYALTGNFLKDELANGISVFETGAEIPHLGKAGGDSSTICDSFLVCPRATPIILRTFKGSDGERVCLDQLANADSVVFLPAGTWNDEVVLQGNVGTASDSQISQSLMKRFQAAIKKSFTKMKAFYVGPCALISLKNGKRLTRSARSPREYDLAVN